jgi:hypothetical protein
LKTLENFRLSLPDKDFIISPQRQRRRKEFSRGRHLFREGARLLRGDRAQVTQVGLVADEHDDDVGVRVVAKLSKPAFDVLIGQVLRDVVHLVSML